MQVDIEGRDVVDADLLVAANGAQSPTRRTLLPVVEPRYAGYPMGRCTRP